MNVRKEGKRMTLCALAAIAVGLLFVGSGAAASAETATISGEVEIANYDDDGNVTEVAIYDREWGSVLVAKNGKGVQLLQQVGAIVSATGELRELDDESGYAYAMDVKSYTIDEPAAPTDPEDDPDYEPED